VVGLGLGRFGEMVWLDPKRLLLPKKKQANPLCNKNSLNLEEI
jgi:hypothetical protein